MKDYYEAYWSEPTPAPTHDPFRPMRWKLLRRHLDGVAPAGRRLLECGSGEGWLLAEAQRWGMEAVGLELSEQAVARTRELHADCQAIVHSVEERPWPVPAAEYG
jgi:cyclopropane fatty-acyl-phospholipid synthase-like methyltransferase